MLSVIVPLYNEEEVIEESYRRLSEALQKTNEDYEILFINDGSNDKTPFLAAEITKRDKKVKLISFSRNFGHQIAITCGMDYAMGDAVIIIDADMQDPPELIADMVKKWKEGYEVVYGKRIKREGETVFKKATASLYYRFLRRMTKVDIPADTGDFRLIDRSVCEAMRSLREEDRYVRGLVSWVGFRQCALPYVREERFAGKTKYPLKKMLRLAMDGITSFSDKPLRASIPLGITVSIAGLIAFIITLIRYFAKTGSGILPLISVLFFLMGLMFIFLGILGIYLGRVFTETKKRPLYIIREKIGF